MFGYRQSVLWVVCSLFLFSLSKGAVVCKYFTAMRFCPIFHSPSHFLRLNGSSKALCEHVAQTMRIVRANTSTHNSIFDKTMDRKTRKKEKKITEYQQQQRWRRHRRRNTVYSLSSSIVFTWLSVPNSHYFYLLSLCQPDAASPRKSK